MQVFGCVCWKGLMALLVARDEEDWHTCRAKPLILFKPRNPLARAFFRSCCLKAFKPVGHDEKKCTLILLSICLGTYFTDRPFWAAAFSCVRTALEETVTLQFTFTPLPDGVQNSCNGTGFGTAAPLCRWTHAQQRRNLIEIVMLCTPYFRRKAEPAIPLTAAEISSRARWISIWEPLI